jgi:hypothetical protein
MSQIGWHFGLTGTEDVVDRQICTREPTPVMGTAEGCVKELHSLARRQRRVRSLSNTMVGSRNKIFIDNQLPRTHTCGLSRRTHTCGLSRKLDGSAHQGSAPKQT